MDGWIMEQQQQQQKEGGDNNNNLGVLRISGYSSFSIFTI